MCSEKFRTFVEQCLKMDLLIALRKIRQGRYYNQPCKTVHSLLNVYAKISGEHLPYGFYRLNKSVAVAYTLPVDKPLTSVTLHGKNGAKNLFLVSATLMDVTVQVNRT